MREKCTPHSAQLSEFSQLNVPEYPAPGPRIRPCQHSEAPFPVTPLPGEALS